MCGITGMAGVEDQQLLQGMLGLIRHRGPDDTGTYFSGGTSASDRVALGNNRLSIIDLSPAGHQPMSNEDQTVWLVFNGEIYNFQELRDELVAQGHRFRSKTDTEVLLHLYERYGDAAVERLNGMFAFALWDSRRKRLLLGRDRFGVKPLYYAQVQDRLYFGSEVKSLLLVPEIPIELNLESLSHYLALLYVPGPETAFRGILKLPPGHCMVWEAGRTGIRPYWDMVAGDYLRDSAEDLAAQLREILKRTVHRQLISDVPVGFFLSGGIDSSALVCLGAGLREAATKAYVISFPPKDAALEQSSHDQEFARLVARQKGIDLHEIAADPDVVSLLPEVIWHMDEPVADPAAIATLLISRAARSELRVLISGQGADEVFAGYRVHLLHRLTRYLRVLPAFLRNGFLAKSNRLLFRHANLVPGMTPGFAAAVSRYFQTLLSTCQLPPREQYIQARSFYSAADLGELLSRELRHSLSGIGFDSKFAQYFAAVETQDFVNQLLYVDCRTFLPDLNLLYSDKLSMAASVEVRVPYLDNEVVDFMLRVPPRLKLRGLTQKYLLRRAMAGVVPEPVVRRRKAGFGLPIRAWVRGKLRPLIDDLLSEERLRKRGLFNPAMIRRMVEEDRNHQADHILRIWALLTFELWQQTFLDHLQEVRRKA